MAVEIAGKPAAPVAEQASVKLVLAKHERYLDMADMTLYEKGKVYLYTRDEALEMLGKLHPSTGVPLFKRYKPTATEIQQQVQVIRQGPPEVDMRAGRRKAVADTSTTSVVAADVTLAKGRVVKGVAIGDDDEIADVLAEVESEAPASDSGEGVEV